MKYYVIYVVNGALQVDKITEWSNLDSAKAKFHDICKVLWNESTVLTASVKILDSQLDNVEDYKEFITHGEN
jgi:hypothetical protein